MLKSWIRRIAIAAFVLSFAPIVPRIGKALAAMRKPPKQGGSDFAFIPNGTKAHINYETANPLCRPLMGGPGAPRVISCNNPYLDSDSYSINAGIDTSNGTDLGTDLTNNGLLVAFFAGPNCKGGILSWQVIPGNQMHVASHKKWTIYAWEGDVPSWSDAKEGSNFDHMEMNLKVNNNKPQDSALHIEAHANLCEWSPFGVYGTPLSSGQPISMIFFIGGKESGDGDLDADCTTFTPSFSAENVSPAVCFGGPGAR